MVFFLLETAGFYSKWNFRILWFFLAPRGFSFRGSDIASRVTFEGLDYLDTLVASDRQGISLRHFFSNQEEGLWSCWGLLEESYTQDRRPYS